MSTKKKATPAAKPATKAPFTKKTMALYETACKALKLNPTKSMPKVSGTPVKHQRAIMAFHMLTTIIEFVNGTWVADYNAGNQKHYTWHWVKASKKNPGGTGFSHACSLYFTTYANVGSRLSFSTASDEQKYRKPLEELYIAFKLIPTVKK